MGGHHKIGLYLGVISMHISVFYYWQGIEWGIIFWAVKILHIFGVLEITDIFGVNGRCWARAYIWRKLEYPPPPGGLRWSNGYQ